MSHTTDVQRMVRAVALTFSVLVAAVHVSHSATAMGYLYTVNNDAQHNGVAVLARQTDGSLTEVAGSPFPTGGKGLGGDIDQQGAIRVYRNYVLAVNPGSQSVAVFQKGEGGQLTPVAGSPFASGGSAPLSLTVHGDLVYVANQAPAFANPSSAPNLVGFRLGPDGTLTPIAHAQIALPAGHGAAQVEFSPGGETVVVTSGFQAEETSHVHGYKVQADGTLTEGPGSPVRVRGASGNVGFSWNPTGTRVYVSNFRGSAITVFDVNKETGGVQQVGGAHGTQGSASCWTVLSSDGKTLYVANFVSNSISIFDVHADGTLGTTKRRGATGPDTKDLTLSKDGKFLYVVGSGAREISVFSVGADRLLTELPAGKSPLQLGAGQNILGLAAD
jgi:6-phosphogluconolactonase